MNLLIALLIVLLIFGGGGYAIGMQPTYHYGGIGSILVIILILWLFRLL